MFARLITQLRREGADRPLRGRPWGLCFEDRVLLVATYWRTNLTMRQLAAVFGVSKSAAAQVIEDLGPALALRPRTPFPRGAALIVDGTLVPTRDHKVAAQSKNYRHSTNHQVVIDADTELVVALGKQLPGNRNDCRAWTESGAAHACRNAVVIADGGYQRTGLIIPHRRSPGCRAAGMETGPQQVTPQGPCPYRACFRSDEDAETPAGLPLTWSRGGCRDGWGSEAGQPRPPLLIHGGWIARRR